jgi:predicted alpha/beta-fold hydrolase
MVFPEFRARLPWLGADLQTLRNHFRGPVFDVSDEDTRRLSLPMRDGSGDQLAAAAHGEIRGVDPVVVLIHGLGGCEDSDYVRASAATLGRRGFPVVRLNLRGAGVSRPTCRLQYHAGRTTDLADALTALREDHGASSFFVVGFSLGGNMLLKFLAEAGTTFPIIGAASVSAPIDLEAACRRILERRNYVYHRVLLDRVRDEACGPSAELSATERRAIAQARTILEFDEHFVAPRNRYAGAREYYIDNGSQRFLNGIRVPTLVVHALDDPWIPGDAYRSFDWSRNSNLLPLLPEEGGHVGFHGVGTRIPWHDRCIGQFLRDLTGRAALLEPRSALGGP